MDTKVIHIAGARQHNLKNLTLDIPRDKLVVVCGPSGSGKSTLAFDIVYAEGQRRYVESLSAYARQFLPQMDKPAIDLIEGLTPAISLEQQTLSKNPRSTVATVTEIYDFLRVFYARLGTPCCPDCGVPIAAQSSDEIMERILGLPEGTKFMILAPLVDHKKGTHADLFKKLKTQGFVRARINGEVTNLDPVPELGKNLKHSIDLVVDRLVLKPDMRKRLADSVELGLKSGQGRIIASIIGGEDIFFSTDAVCPRCSLSLPKPSPQLFSFNSPQGACPHCSGLGSVEYYEPMLLAPNGGLSLRQGAILPWKGRAFDRYAHDLKELGLKHGFTLETPLQEFSPKARQALFHGDAQWPGVIHFLEQGSGLGHIWRDELARYRQTMDCPSCQGARLRPESLAVRIEGLSIFEFCSLPITRALGWLQGLRFSGVNVEISTPLMKELCHRLEFLANVGLDYINLARNMSTLSGGEAQRIRLAGQLGSGLVGVTYVLDEPSIGLHPRDNQRLINTLRQLQGRGNTVLVVEHDEPTIRAADHVLELGPGSGFLGGELVFAGTPHDLVTTSKSLTGKYLRGELRIARPAKRRTSDRAITLRGVTTNNLRGIDARFPLSSLVCITGVSGSGKSTLINDTLYAAAAKHLYGSTTEPAPHKEIIGLDLFDKVINVDQAPIGRTPRSNPATYTGLLTPIRELFSQVPESRVRGYGPGRFSFNVKGGRCEACQGDGMIKVEMHFLPDIYVPCDVCHGKRYNRETLEVQYKGKTIHDVLGMTVEQAREFFDPVPVVARKLQTLVDVGLSYITLGQSATTLSGGEAQRVKLALELSKRDTGRTLYILDEPTTGLHMHEVGKLIAVLHTLVDKGASVIVIEHNLDVVAAADHVMDLGPGGGENGGLIVAQGTPEELKQNPGSVTGPFLEL